MTLSTRIQTLSDALANVDLTRTGKLFRIVVRSYWTFDGYATSGGEDPRSR
jgi:hypothetical protein